MRTGVNTRELEPQQYVETYLSVLKGVRSANSEDLDFFVSVLGQKTKEYLDSLGAPIFVFKDKVFIKSKSTLGDSIASPQDTASWIYLRTNFITVIDDRVVTIPVWRKEKKGLFTSSAANKVTQIDFMFLDDWIGPDPGYVVYKREKGKSRSSEDLSESVAFLLKMKDLVLSISSDCVVQLSPATRQRGRILKRHLKGHHNVRFLPVQI